MSTPERGAERELEIPLPPRRRVFVRLDELDSDDDRLGKRTRFRGFNAAVLRLARQFDADPDTEAPLLWEMAAEMLPDLTAAEVERLSPDTVVQLIELAKQPITALEAIAKNAAPPLVEAGKGSNSRTPSPTGSRRSPRATGRTRTT